MSVTFQPAFTSITADFAIPKYFFDPNPMAVTTFYY
jgi:hypothetical protein